MQTFPFQILSPEKIIYQGEIVSLVAPGQEGYLGVWALHAPMLAALTAGEVKITDAEGKTTYFAVSGGMLEVEQEEVALLADAAEKIEEIDTQRAEEAKSRAAARLKQHTQDLDIARAQAALMRAINRLQLVTKHKTSP